MVKYELSEDFAYSGLPEPIYLIHEAVQSGATDLDPLDLLYNVDLTDIQFDPDDVEEEVPKKPDFVEDIAPGSYGDIDIPDDGFEMPPMDNEELPF